MDCGGQAGENAGKSEIMGLLTQGYLWEAEPELSEG